MKNISMFWTSLIFVIMIGFVSVLTAQEVVINTFPWIEDFNNPAPYAQSGVPAGWLRIGTATGTPINATYVVPTTPFTTVTWSFGIDSYFTNNAVHPFGNALSILVNTSRNTFMFTPKIDLGTIGHNKWLFFDIARVHSTASNVGEPVDNANTVIDLYISVDGGLTLEPTDRIHRWTNNPTYSGVENISSLNAIGTAGRRFAFDLSEYDGEVKFAFYCHSSGSGAQNRITIDNVTISERTQVFKPFDLGTVITSPAIKSFMFSNMDSTAFEVDVISFSGDNADIYSIASAPGVITPSIAAGDIIGALGYSFLYIAYTPTAYDITHTAALNITKVGGGVVSIPLSGKYWDGVISYFPYNEGFDAQYPDLPLGWSKIIEAPSGTPSITLTTASAQSQPFAVQLANSTNSATTNYIALVSPKIENTNVKSLKFKALTTASSVTSIDIGYMSDPTDTETYNFHRKLELVANEVITDQVLVFNSLPPGDHHIVFRHGMDANNRTIRIDSVIFDEHPDDTPILVFLPSKPTTIAFSTILAGQYKDMTQAIMNVGTGDLTINFTGIPTGISIFPATPIIVPPDSTQIITYRWDSTIFGTFPAGTTLTMTTDDPTNASVDFTVTGTATVIADLPLGDRQIGNGTTAGTTTYSPWLPTQATGVYQQIYHPNEINIPAGVEISKLAYQYIGAATDVPQAVDIYMGHTTKPIFSGMTAEDWVPFSSMTLVFSGLVNLPTSASPIWVDIPLLRQFPYNGEDYLVIGVYDYTGSVQAGAHFRGDSGASRSLRLCSTVPTSYDIFNLPSANRPNNIPNTRLTFAPPSTDPNIFVSPSVVDFGLNLAQGQPVPSRTITIHNMGAVDVEILDIDIIGDAEFTISYPELDTHGILSTDDIFIITVDFSTAVVGTFEATIAIETDIVANPFTFVEINGHIKDYSIFTSTHTENFNSYALPFPAFPSGWGIIATSTGDTPPSYGFTTTVDNGGSTPNAYRLNGGDGTDANLILYTPYIDNLNYKQVRFKLRDQGSIYGSGIEIGTMAVVGDFSTWQPLREVYSIRSEYYEEYYCSLVEATGNYLGFRYLPLSAGLGVDILIDDVVIEPAVTEPIAHIHSVFRGTSNATSIYRNIGYVDFGTFSINQIGSSVVTIENRGGDVLTINHTYSDLFTHNLTDYIEIPVNSSVDIMYYFAPELTGTTVLADNIYVPLTTNATNIDPQGIPIVANVLPHTLGTNVVQVGHTAMATSPNYAIPWDITNARANSYFQMIYLANELNRSIDSTEVISKIAYEFRANIGGTNDIIVFMGYTDKYSFDHPSQWLPNDTFVEVFNGPITLENQSSVSYWVEIPLNPPFLYDPTQNLVIAVQSSRTTAVSTTATNFSVSTSYVGSRSAGVVRANTSGVYDLSNLPATPVQALNALGTNSVYPNIRFTFERMLDYSLLVTPDSLNYGLVGLGYPDHLETKTITLFNNGEIPVIIDSLYIAGTDSLEFSYTLADTTLTFPLDIQSTDYIQLHIDHNPLSVGEKRARIIISHNDGANIEEITLWSEVTDYTIRNFPYGESFDNPPIVEGTTQVPHGWTVINETTTANTYIRPQFPGDLTSFPRPFDTDYSLLINHGAGLPTGHLMISTPPVDSLSGKRIRFWARSGIADTLMIGSITDYLNPETFQHITSVRITSTWSPFVVDLSSATGNRLAFKHPLAGRASNFYIDELEIEELYEGANFYYAQKSIDYRYDIYYRTTGENSNVVIAGMPETRYVEFRNIGNAPLDIFTIPHQTLSLKNVDDHITIAPDSTVTIGVILTAETVGTYRDDLEFQSNDLRNLIITIPVYANVVEAPPAGIVQIGANTSNTNPGLPMNNSGFANYTQTIIHAEELSPIPDGNAIQMIAYQLSGTNAGAGNTWTQSSIKIWMGYTDLEEFTGNTQADWVPLDSLTLVFDGTMTATPNVAGIPTWVDLYLRDGNNQFIHQAGKNLIIAFLDNDGSTLTNPGMFYSTERPQNRSLRSTGSSITPPPATGNTMLKYIPNMRLHFNEPFVAYYNISGRLIEGHLSDPTPVNGATITLTGNGYNEVVESGSGIWASGYFEIPDIATGTHYVLTISMMGYATLVDTFDVTEDIDKGDIPFWNENYIVDDGDNTLPIVTALGGNYPNPFNPSTTIEFAIRTSILGMNNVSIEIFNIKGQKVRSLVNDTFSSGTHRVVWNGTDDNGRPVSSGIYFYRMKTEGYVATKKMILMK